jgi:hypothetical protein
VKCVRCPEWDADSPDARAPIMGLCRAHCLEVMKAARRRGDPLIIRSDYVPPPSKRERVILGMKIWWWKGKWRAK